MRAFQNTSIKRKMTLIIMLTSGVALLLACAAFVAYERITFRDTMVRDLFILAEIIGYNSTAALTFDDEGSAEETLWALSAEPHIVSACIYTKDGNVFARYLRGGVNGVPSPEPAEDSHRFVDDHLVLFHSIVLDGEKIGTVYLQSDLQEMHARLRRYAGIVVLVMSASSLAAFGLSSKLRRVISEPILHLVQTARVVSDKKDYSVRAAKHSQDEVGLLIDAFNEMLAQIQERDATLEKRAQELQKELTERKRAEEAFNLLFTLINSLPYQIYIKNTNSEFEFANEEMVRALKRETSEDLTGLTDFDLIPRELAEGHYIEEQTLLRTGEPIIDREVSSIDSEGNRQWSLTTKVPFRDDQGHIVGFVGINRSITERKRAEEALREAHDKLEIRVAERTAELRKANEALHQEIVERKQAEDELKIYAAKLERGAALDRVRVSVYEMRESTDIQSVLASLYEALRDVGLDFDHCSVQIVDEEKECFEGYPDQVRRMIEMPLRDSAVYEAWRDKRPIYRGDLDAEDTYNDRANIRKASDKHIRSVLDVPFSHGTIGINSTQPDAFSEADIETLEQFAEVLSEAYTRFEDFEAVRQAEEALAQRAEALARSNAELENFAYVASHDLQEPLRKIQAFGDRLKTKYADTLSGQGSDYLERMQNAAGRMQTLINDLLAFSRVTTKAQPFLPVDLAEVAREVVDDLEVRIEETGGRVEVNDLPTIDADPLQMRQLLQNVIGNALKFHRKEEAPVVEIRSQLLEDRIAVDGLVQITVEDNGIGFDEKYADRIFGIFQRLHGRGAYEGTGVGLAICRKIVERHGGSITAESTPGQGTTFIVTLPVQHPKGEEAL